MGFAWPPWAPGFCIHRRKATLKGGRARLPASEEASARTAFLLRPATAREMLRVALSPTAITLPSPPRAEPLPGTESAWLLPSQASFSLGTGTLLSAALAVCTRSAPLVMDSVLLGSEITQAAEQTFSPQETLEASHQPFCFLASAPSPARPPSLSPNAPQPWSTCRAWPAGWLCGTGCLWLAFFSYCSSPQGGRAAASQPAAWCQHRVSAGPEPSVTRKS